MAKSTITREQITSWMNDANYALEEPLNADDAAAARAILAMGHELLAAMDQKPALHRYRRKAVEPYGPYPWHYEVFVDYPRPVECIEDEYFYAAPPVVTGFAVDGEPVARLLSGGGAKNMVCFDSGNAYADPLREVTPLYRHAQPAPVVTEVINKLLAIIDRHTVKLGWGEKPITLAELVIARDGSDELEYCRVAMLQAGISAVIPDGYVMVPREPTEEMNKAGWAAMNEHDAINPTYRAMLAAAPHDTPDLNSVQSVATVPGKWIQVSERMPEVGVKVLCFPVKDEPIHATFNGQLWLQDISWSGSDEPIDNVIPTSVTHWMPLPTAPQEEKP